jgi:hypothetical protein
VLVLAALVVTLLRFRARACVMLACIAALLCAAMTASALDGVQTKTRVWAFESARPLNICPNALASPRTQLENHSCRLEQALASPHAARGLPKVVDILRPGGKLIGEAGSSSSIRILQGGKAQAEAIFGQLSRGGEVIKGTSYPGTLVRLAEGGTVGLRPVSTSGPPTIDVALKGLGIREIKFLP